jgi:hypothetical protein
MSILESDILDYVGKDIIHILLAKAMSTRNGHNQSPSTTERPVSDYLHIGGKQANWSRIITTISAGIQRSSCRQHRNPE